MAARRVEVFATGTMNSHFFVTGQISMKFLRFFFHMLELYILLLSDSLQGFNAECTNGRISHISNQSNQIKFIRHKQSTQYNSS